MTRFISALLLALAFLAGPSLAGTLTFDSYYHNDHLGSPVAATDERGDLLWRAHFRPYGERQENPTDAAFGNVGYTGHTQDADSGLVYMQARYYDPLIGRFMAVDPAEVNPESAISFNRYAYANNSPYGFIDPDGRHPAFLWGLGVGFAGAMGHSDYAQAPAVDEAPTTMGAIDHLGALPGLNAAKGLKGVRMADKAKVAKGTRAVAEPVFKTTKEAKAAAEALGFKKINETVHDGQAVFKRGKDFITRDLDGHNGGAWKMADSVKNLASKETRSGTFDVNLNRIGD